MKAARWHGAKDIRVEDLPEPEPGDGQVKVKVAWAGICGSDLHEYLAGPIFVPVGDNHPLSQDKAPVIMGHEYCGEVVSLGEGVEGLAAGDRIAIEPIYRCGVCTDCRDGKYNLCEKLGFMGLSGGIAGFSGYSVVPANMAHKMPEGLSMEQGALVEPAAVALHAVRQSRLKAGDKAAVFGTGPIGLLVVEVLKIAGASEIYVVEPSGARRQKALDLGARMGVDQPGKTRPLRFWKRPMAACMSPLRSRVCLRSCHRPSVRHVEAVRPSLSRYGKRKPASSPTPS